MPAYRRNAQVKTLDMIIAERTRAAAAAPSTAAPAGATDDPEQGEHANLSVMYTDQWCLAAANASMAPVPASRFYGEKTGANV